MTAVIGVRGGACCDFAQKITRDDGVGVSAANPALSVRGYFAWSHMTNLAADALCPDFTRNTLGIRPCKTGFDAVFLRL